MGFRPDGIKSSGMAARTSCLSSLLPASCFSYERIITTTVEVFFYFDVACFAEKALGQYHWLRRDLSVGRFPYVIKSRSWPTRLQNARGEVHYLLDGSMFYLIFGTPARAGPGRFLLFLTIHLLTRFIFYKNKPLKSAPRGSPSDLKLWWCNNGDIIICHTRTRCESSSPRRRNEPLGYYFTILDIIVGFIGAYYRGEAYFSFCC